MPRKRRKATDRRSVELTIEGKAVPRDLFEDGVIRFSVGASGREGENRRRELRKLKTWRAWDVLRALQRGDLDPGNAAARIKEEGESALAGLRKSFLYGLAPTLGAERDKYLVWYERNRKDRSYIQIGSRLKRFLEQTGAAGLPLERVPMDRLASDEIERAVAAISGRPGTQNSIRAAVSGLYSWSIRSEAEAARLENRSPRWSVNPASDVEQRETHARTVTATEAQVRALLENAEIHQRAYLRAFVHLGFRKDELTHSRLHLDLDLSDWTWKIQPRDPDDRCGCPKCRGKGWTPKVTRSHRAILVPVRPDALRHAITEYLEVYPCEPGDFVFRNPRTNRVWDEKALSVDFEKLCERAGVRYGRDVPGGIVIHDLRATCATELDKAGVSLKVIAELLGDDPSTVMKKYLRVKPSEIADGISRGPSYS